MNDLQFIKEFKKITMKEASIYASVAYPNLSAGKISKVKAKKVVNFIVTNFMSIYSQYLISKELNDDE